ncbi:formimidoylglutamate deiminase [Altererythrobacter sp. B11]|uniref:formimidoylglutamate deiminase n=1 Tax=Altererythrobacter sp. B11 TaxID=2060312 RepID=UPI000DC72DAE|nr:formimidoylglutamate deiminase [Altererythrobacter sp. B11]BBC73390.1 formimidoylglutamate deiminase [Altererythrobacter sp. B11]
MTGLWFERALLPTGWASNVAVDLTHRGTIAAIATDCADAGERMRYGVALPGVPNLHSHAFQRAMAGLTERREEARDTFWSWRSLMYRFAGRVGPEALQAIAALAYMEMLESGFTRVGEFHYLHHQPDGWEYDTPALMAQALASAAAECGIALTLLPVFYASADFGGTPPAAEQRRFVSTRDSYDRLFDGSEAAIAGLEDAIVGIAPHSLRATPLPDLNHLAHLRSDAPVHIHIAEQQQEVEACLAWSGKRPIELLLDNAEVDARWCLVHATHLDAGERKRVAASGAVVGLCPITEANLGDGLFPVAEFLEEQGVIGIGSDSNVRIDAAAELQWLEYGQRLTRQARNVAAIPGPSTGRSLFDHAVAGGARALGQNYHGIVVGAPADIVSLEASSIDLVGREDDAILDSWIFARAQVESVWRRGRMYVSGGRHCERDAIEHKYKQVVTRLLQDA